MIACSLCNTGNIQTMVSMLCAECSANLRAEIKRIAAKLQAVRKLVDEQAEDEMLWAVPIEGGGCFAVDTRSSIASSAARAA